MQTHNIILVGVGPHAKRIYLNYLKKHKRTVKLSYVIDLESNHLILRDYLDKEGFKDTKLFLIPDIYKDNKHLPMDIEKKLEGICKSSNITEILVSTEPKSHYMYIEFALKMNINVLTDKPITVEKDMTSLKSINNVRKDFYDLCEMEDKSTGKCYVMCQRKYHKGYNYIKKILKDVVMRYQVPITYIDIYHCDGNWEMIHDLEKENHPYKYGYGKLFHSGYHFIDLLSDFLKMNNYLSDSKKINNGYIYSETFTPNDETAVFDLSDYKRVFSKQNIPEVYNHLSKNDLTFKGYGEKNFYGLLTFKNKMGQTITTANLNLLHYGFSRRGWIESKNYYKENGRIRHERMNIQVGTLLNIQIHSYQSKEIKNRLSNEIEEKTGGLEHFDIDIYRNVDIIGGKPYERISLGDLYTEKEKKDFLGYNELSREIFLNNFFRGTCSTSHLKDHTLAIEILYSCAKGLHNRYKNVKRIENINTKQQFKVYNELDFDMLKTYSEKSYVDWPKTLVEHFEIPKSKYLFGANVAYIKEQNLYETFLFIENEEKSVGRLLLKSNNNKLISYIYYYYLKFLLNNSNEERLIKYIFNKTVFKRT